MKAKMKNSKIISIISLAVCFMTVLCACSGDSGETTTTTQSSKQTTTEKQPEPVKTVKRSFIVKEQDGSPVANVTVNLTGKSGVVASGKTDETGVVTISAPVGDYTVTFEDLPSGYLGVPRAVKFDDSGETITLSVTNNIPDGTADKPFLLSEKETQLKLAPGQSVYYTLFSSGVIITADCKDIRIVYNDKEYTADGQGVINFTVDSVEDRDKISLVVVNLTDNEVSTSILMEYPLGSGDNPYTAELGTRYTAIIGKEGGVYYKYTASKDGIIEVRSDNELNNICLTNLTTSVVTSFTSGAKSSYLNVKAGDDVRVTVSSLALNGGEIDFSLALYEGSDKQPVVFEGKELTFGYAPGQSVCFEINNTGVYNTVVINGASAKAIYNGQTFTAGDSGEIRITLSEDENEGSFKITIINVSDQRHEISFRLRNI